MNLEKLSVAFCALALFLCVGCGGGTADDAPQLGQVTGTVTIDGNPLANVSVTFTSEKNQVSFATTDDQGKYELTYRGSNKGAEVGTQKVIIETVLEAPAGPGYKDPIPAKYNKQTTLTATVKEGENPPIDFALDSK